jgi:hypothetical protein
MLTVGIAQSVAIQREKITEFFPGIEIKPTRQSFANTYCDSERLSTEDFLTRSLCLIASHFQAS